MKTFTLSEMEDKHIGEKGTKERDEYEYQLRMELLGRMIKATRKEQKQRKQKQSYIMKNFITTLLILLSVGLSAQSIESHALNGCEKPRGKTMKKICSTDNFNTLINDYLFNYVNTYGDRVPQGEATLLLKINTNGQIEILGYKDFKNENFAKFLVIIANDIKKDFEKYQISYKPAINRETNEPVDFDFQVQTSLYEEK